MNKQENAIGNLKEILCAIADGKEVQYMGADKVWRTPKNMADWNPFNKYNHEWRIKRDDFESFYEDYITAEKLSSKTTRELMLISRRELMLSGWNAAMELRR